MMRNVQVTTNVYQSIVHWQTTAGSTSPAFATASDDGTADLLGGFLGILNKAVSFTQMQYKMPKCFVTGQLNMADRRF